MAKPLGIRMISIIRPPNAGPTPLSRSVAAPGPQRETTAAAPLITVPSVKERAREMASRRLEFVRAKVEALKLMVKIDPRSALKLAGEIARELKAATKAFRESGGRDVSDADMALMKHRVEGVEAARDTASGAGADDQVRRADDELDRLAGMQAEMTGDKGVFDEIRRFLATLKKARDDIRGEATTSFRAPSEADWRAFDRDQAELERELARAGAGPRVSVTA